MTVFSLVLCFLSAFGLLKGADSDLSRQQQDLKAVYQDVEQVYNEASARGRLIDENFKASISLIDKNTPEMENLQFKMKGMLEPSLDIRRQMGLVTKYRDDVTRLSSQIRQAHEGIESQVKDTCDQIKKWQDKGRQDAKRIELLEQSRRVLQTVVLRLEKTKEWLEDAQKVVFKISGMSEQAVAFSAKLDNLLETANSLANPLEEARRIWASEQKELTTIHLRLKTLEILNARTVDLVQNLNPKDMSPQELHYAKEQADIIESYYKEIFKLNQHLTDSSKQITDGLERFDADAKSFKEFTAKIMSPFQNGLLQSLTDSSRDAQSQFVSAAHTNEDAVNNLNKLRLCIGQIEEESDLTNIPNLKGLSYDEALQRLQEANLKGEKRSGIPAPQKILSGKVYEQSPSEGQKVLPGSVVIVRVYETYSSIIPDIVGKTVEEANEVLTKMGLKGSAKVGEAAPDAESEGRIYSQFPRAFSTGSEGAEVRFQYYDKVPVQNTDEKFSDKPFFVLCRLYIPRLKPNSPEKSELTIANINFIEREMPFIIAVQEIALDRYPLSFFEPNKAISTFIQIIGKDLKSGQTSQYDGALLLEVVQIYYSFDEIKQKVVTPLEFNDQDPLAYIKFTQSSGLFNGISSTGDVQLKWQGGPLITGWSARMKEGSFSLFRQLL